MILAFKSTNDFGLKRFSDVSTFQRCMIFYDFYFRHMNPLDHRLKEFDLGKLRDREVAQVAYPIEPAGAII
jgi:hypothetical protein